MTLATALACPAPAAAEARWLGKLSARYQAFTQSARFDDQPEAQTDVIGEVEYYNELGEASAFTLKPYVRAELHGHGDTFTDLREAMWLTYGDDWELRAGVGKVFWGVTESVHLVDIVNQTDFEEDTDGEEKLGQPMVQGTWLLDNGAASAFLLPYFRTRELPERHDRPRFALPVDNDAAEFESSREEQHLDFALRLTQTYDAVDLGLSYFDGTARAPRLIAADGRLVPFYPLLQQWGLDVQITTAEWLWKLEAIRRRDDRDSWGAAAGGFEYTFVGVFESAADIGVLAEYLYDDRGDRADNPFQDDLLVGLRWVLNDPQSTEVLFGIIGDLDGGGRALNLEASRRLGASYKLNLDARAFVDAREDPQLTAFARDDFVRLELGYYF